ncbi:MAG: pseudouridine synthase [Paracoccus sp. (in: a-proteobacteria)]|nr:pseudouridine synthase [Paracoccus sp. (in: a-proteobacteria)]
MTDTTPIPDKGPERIAKVIARAGVASRREAERMILEGRVAVNGRKIDSPALDVHPSDQVTVDGKSLDAPQETRLWLYYKPLGLITSESDEKGRQTVFDALPRDLPRVVTVGRLDLNSEGLLLLTNDGELKRRLELPATGWLRRYRVRVNGTPNDLTFAPLRRGIVIDGEEFAPMEIKLDSQQGANAWLTVGIREGKNREIRRAMAHVGLQVNRLIRIGYGPCKLGTMEKNEVVEVRRRVLRDQLGGLLTGEVDQRPREMRSHGAQGARGPRAADETGARRFGAKPAGARPFAPRGEGEDRPKRGGPAFAARAAGARGGYGDRPRREDSPETGERKPRLDRHGGADRPARFEGKAGGDRRPFGKPGPRGGSGAGPAAGDARPRGFGPARDEVRSEGQRSEKPWSKKQRSDKSRPDTSRGEGLHGARVQAEKPWAGKSRPDKPRADATGSDPPRSDPSGTKGARVGTSSARPGGRQAGDRPGSDHGQGPRKFTGKPEGKPGGTPRGRHGPGGPRNRDR